MAQTDKYSSVSPFDQSNRAFKPSLSEMAYRRGERDRRKLIEDESGSLSVKFNDYRPNETDKSLILVDMFHLSERFDVLEMLLILNLVAYRGSSVKTVLFSACYAMTYFEIEEIGELERAVFCTLLHLSQASKIDIVQTTALNVRMFHNSPDIESFMASYK